MVSASNENAAHHREGVPSGRRVGESFMMLLGYAQVNLPRHVDG
jgi:hypothetical protein